MDYAHAFFLYCAGVKVADALVVWAMWHLCWYLRFHSDQFPITKGLPPHSIYVDAALPLVLVFSVVFHMVGAYRRDRIHFGFRSLKKMVQACFMATLVFVSILYFLRELHYSRIFLALFPFVVIPAIALERGLCHLAWKTVQARAVEKIRILLMGKGNLLQMYVDKLRIRKPYPFKLIGRLGEPQAEGYLGGLPYLGKEEELSRVLDTQTVDTVVVAYPNEESARYQPLLQSLSNELVTVKVLPDFGKYSTFAYQAEHECGIPVLMFNHAPTGATDRVVKRAFDLVGSLAFLVVFSPLYLAIAALVKLTSRGPVLYSQMRMGADGRTFLIYKFRSMRLDAEAKTGAVWAKEGDDRTTPLGRVLRRTSLDEIPQFYNVLIGDMSLVGPRPERPVFVEQFRKDVPKYMLRHKMKSGITGWAQVNGWRGNTSIEQRIKYDLFYIGHWSHLFDLKILLMTLWKGFVNRHAY